MIQPRVSRGWIIRTSPQRPQRLRGEAPKYLVSRRSFPSSLLNPFGRRQLALKQRWRFLSFCPGLNQKKKNCFPNVSFHPQFLGNETSLNRFRQDGLGDQNLRGRLFCRLGDREGRKGLVHSPLNRLK